MKKEIPEIDELLDGINSADLPIGSDSKPQTASESKSEATDNASDEMEKQWLDFLHSLETTAVNEKAEKNERLVCKLDRDLADSLDECDIHDRCRSDLVNAIVRAFFNAYLPRLVPFRREKKSLFETYKTVQE